MYIFFLAQRACVAYIWLLFKYAFICIYIYLLWNYPFTSGAPTAGVSVARLTTVINMDIDYDKSTWNENMIRHLPCYCLKYLSYNILSIIINDVLWRVYGQFITCVYIWQMSYHIFVPCALIIINVHVNNCS
jgi:hypothetical protein